MAKKYVILDTETTGVGESDRVIQLGYVVLGAKDVEVHNEFYSSDVAIGFGAMEVHGITPEMLQGKPVCIDSVAYKRLCELNTSENYMIIHNAPFDLGMLEKEGFKTQMKVIDTLRVAKHVLPDEDWVIDKDVYGMMPSFELYLEKNKELLRADCRSLRSISKSKIDQILISIPRDWGLTESARLKWSNLLYQRAQFLSRELPSLIFEQKELRI
ncbi:MAG: 3'-5' exonuclease [Methylococcales bacterium]